MFERQGWDPKKNKANVLKLKIIIYIVNEIPVKCISVNSVLYVCVCLLAAWQEVEQKLGDANGAESTNSHGPIQYAEKTPSAAMKSKYLHLCNTHSFTGLNSSKKTTKSIRPDILLLTVV